MLMQSNMSQKTQRQKQGDFFGSQKQKTPTLEFTRALPVRTTPHTLDAKYVKTAFAEIKNDPKATKSDYNPDGRDLRGWLQRRKPNNATTQTQNGVALAQQNITHASPDQAKSNEHGMSHALPIV